MYILANGKLITRDPACGYLPDGGVVIDGKIYEGQASAGAELGHCTLISGGVECTCGRRGCIESYASATALIRQASEAAVAHPESLLNKERITAKSVYDAMRAGDDAAKAVVAQYEEYLGEAIVDMVNIFRPEMLLLGGGSFSAGGMLGEMLLGGAVGALTGAVRANLHPRRIRAVQG